MSADLSQRVERPFLSGEPPVWVARAVGGILIGGAALALLAAAVVPIPEVVSGPFTLRPTTEPDPMRAPSSGRVMEVLVVEGGSVRAGEPLLRLEVHAEAELELLGLQAGGAEERRQVMERGREREAEADAERIAGLERRLEGLDRAIALSARLTRRAVEEAERTEKLTRQQVAAAAELSAQQADAEEQELRTLMLRLEREDVAAELAALRHSVLARDAALAEAASAVALDAAQAELRGARLRERLALDADGLLSIRSPCDGALLRLYARTPGAPVVEGEVLARVACGDEPLGVEMLLDDDAVGRLRVGQDVKLFFDAWPAARHGVGYATLRWIGPSALPAEQGPAFRVLADLAGGGPLDSPEQGPSSPWILAGMGGQAEVIVGATTPLMRALPLLRALFEETRTARSDN